MLLIIHFTRWICMSESQRSSIRVSPHFNLARHSSPSFGSQHLCSAYSQQCQVYGKLQDCTLQIIPWAGKLLFAFTVSRFLGFVNPMTCIHVKTPWSVFLDRSEGPLTYSAESSHVPVKQRARTPRAVTMKNYILCKALSEKLYFVCHEIQ